MSFQRKLSLSDIGIGFSFCTVLSCQLNWLLAYIVMMGGTLNTLPWQNLSCSVGRAINVRKVIDWQIVIWDVFIGDLNRLDWTNLKWGQVRGNYSRFLLSLFYVYVYIWRNIYLASLWFSVRVSPKLVRQGEYTPPRLYRHQKQQQQNTEGYSIVFCCQQSEMSFLTSSKHDLNFYLYVFRC